jgi:hypothetical protein
MSWALPFLFMQLLVKARSAAELVAMTQGNFLALSVVGLALFFLFIHVATSRFSLAHDKEGGNREFKGRLVRGFSKASR